MDSINCTDSAAHLIVRSGKFRMQERDVPTDGVVENVCRRQVAVTENHLWRVRDLET